MFLDVAYFALLVAESFGWIVAAEFLDEGRSVAGDIAGEIDSVDALEDDVVRLHGVGSGEGRSAGEELKHEDAQGPIVGADVVAFVENHLGSDVLGGAAKGPRLAAGLQLFGESKVDQFDVAGRVEEKIFGFEVAVDDAAAVKVVERLHDASRVEARGRVVEIAPVPEDGPELAAQAGLHQHVEVLAVLERFVQLDYKLAIGLLHNLLLRHDVLLLPRLHNLIFSIKKIHIVHSMVNQPFFGYNFHLK